MNNDINLKGNIGILILGEIRIYKDILNILIRIYINRNIHINDNINISK